MRDMKALDDLAGDGGDEQRHERGRFVAGVWPPRVHTLGFMMSPRLGLGGLKEFSVSIVNRDSHPGLYHFAPVGARKTRVWARRRRLPRSPRRSKRSLAVFQKPWKGGIV